MSKSIFRLVFEIQFANHETCEAEYLANLDEFIENSRATLPPVYV
jgi:hypothetical protein